MNLPEHKNSNSISTSKEVKKEGYTIQDRIDLIIELDKRLNSLHDRIKDKGWDNKKDSRMLFIRYISELNTSTIFQLSFLAESHEKTKDKNWLKKRLPHLEKQIDEISDIEKYSINRNSNISRGIWNCFILKYFYEFESRIRNIVRHIGSIRNPQRTKYKAPLTGNEPFYWLYRGLYENCLFFDKQDYEVLKLFSEIRNTIHNSGFFFPNRKEPKTYHYRGKTYIFRYGTPVNFITMEFISDLLTDIIVLFDKTITNKKISDIPKIKDPIAEVSFEF